MLKVRSSIFRVIAGFPSIGLLSTTVIRPLWACTNCRTLCPSVRTTETAAPSPTSSVTSSDVEHSKESPTFSLSKSSVRVRAVSVQINRVIKDPSDILVLLLYEPRCFRGNGAFRWADIEIMTEIFGS